MQEKTVFWSNSTVFCTLRGIQRAKAKLNPSTVNSTHSATQNDAFVCQKRGFENSDLIDSPAKKSMIVLPKNQPVNGLMPEMPKYKCQFCDKLFVFNGNSLINHQSKH